MKQKLTFLLSFCLFFQILCGAAQAAGEDTKKYIGYTGHNAPSLYSIQQSQSSEDDALSFDAQFSEAFLLLLNDSRAAQGNRPLSLRTELQELMEQRAQYGFSLYFGPYTVAQMHASAHLLPDGRAAQSLLGESRYAQDYLYLGEVALGMSESAPRTAQEYAQQVFALWAQSEGHRAVLQREEASGLAVGVALQDVTQQNGTIQYQLCVYAWLLKEL